MAWVTYIKEMRMWTVNTTTNKNFRTTAFRNCISSPTSLGDWFWTLKLPFRPIFIWMSKIFRNYIGFALLRTVIWPKNFAPPPPQSIKCKTKTIHDLVAHVLPPAFSRALGSLVVITLALKGIFFSSDWLLRLLWFWFYHNQSSAQKPIGCETKTIRDLVTCIFPRSSHFCSFSCWTLISSLWHFRLF